MTRRWPYLLTVAAFLLCGLLFHLGPLHSEDALEFHEIAKNLASGLGYSYQGAPTIIRPPMYIWLVALLYKIFNFSTLPVIILNIGLILGTLWYLNKIFSTLFTAQNARQKKQLKLTGNLLNVFFALYFPHYIYAYQVLSEPLIIFLFTASLYHLVRRELSPFILFFTALVLTKGVFVVYPLFVYGYYFIKEKKLLPLLQLFIIYLSFLLLVSPWMLRNKTLFNKYIYSSIGMGNVLWYGNNLANNGYKDLSNDPVWQEITAKHDPVTADSLLKKLAIQEIRQHPGQSAWLFVKKFGRFWRQAIGFQTLTEKSIPLAYLWQIGFWGILLLALLGLKNNFAKPEVQILSVIIVQYWAIHSLMLPIPRYHYALIPILLILAAQGTTVLLKTKIGYRLLKQH